MRIELTAHRTDLGTQLGTLQYEEWGRYEGGTVEQWIQIAISDHGVTELPVGFVAIEDGVVIGGVSLREFDIEERMDRSPWINGMLVRKGRRREGIGYALMAQLEEWAVQVGLTEGWVWTKSAATFYERCAWTRVEELIHQGEAGMVLHRFFGRQAQ